MLGGLAAVGAGDNGDFAALLERGRLPGGHDHGVALCADQLGAVLLADGVGEAVGFFGAVEDDNGVLVGDQVNLVVLREEIAQSGDDLVGVALLADVVEVEGLDGAEF